MTGLGKTRRLPASRQYRSAWMEGNNKHYSGHTQYRVSMQNVRRLITTSSVVLYSCAVIVCYGQQWPWY